MIILGRTKRNESVRNIKIIPIKMTSLLCHIGLRRIIKHQITRISFRVRNESILILRMHHLSHILLRRKMKLIVKSIIRNENIRFMKISVVTINLRKENCLSSKVASLRLNHPKIQSKLVCLRIGWKLTGLIRRSLGISWNMAKINDRKVSIVFITWSRFPSESSHRMVRLI